MACLYGCDFSLALVILLHWGSQFGWPHKSLISKAQYCHASKGHHYPPESFHQFLLWLLHTSPLQQQLQPPALTPVLSFLDYATVAEKDDFRFLDDPAPECNLRAPQYCSLNIRRGERGEHSSCEILEGTGIWNT